MEYCSDTVIVESINRGLDQWLDSGGEISAFINGIFNEAKGYGSKAHNEWRGAVLIYVVGGSGIKLPTEMKLLMLDCINSWHDRVVAENGVDQVEKMKILTEMECFREYCLKQWGSSIPWCRNIVSRTVAEYMRFKFWTIAVKEADPYAKKVKVC